MADGDSSNENEAENDEIVDVIGGACYDLSEHSIVIDASSPDTKGQHWTTEEQNLFYVGLEQFGNKWSQIAKLVGTRTSAQVKSHAKHYFKTCLNKESVRNELSEAVQIVQTTEEAMVDVDETTNGCSTVQNATSHVIEDSNLEAGRSEALFVSKQVPCTISEKDDVPALGINFQVADNIENVPVVCGETDNVEDMSDTCSEANNVENVPIICSEVISEDEKREHPEFFRGGSKKTPSRYLAIRNHILGHWEKKRPHYLTKLAARRGLSHCGDVNSISKIHSYLERQGAINDKCVQKRRGRPCKVPDRHTEPLFSERMQLRQRRAPPVIEDFTNSGRTIEHDEEGNIVRETFITAVPTVAQRPSNPFKLVPCCPYSTDDPQPFEVSVDLSSVLVMDAHAHCLKTEVMGLLGGHCYPGRVCVQLAIPCESLSTGIECEMDPVSQAMAGEKIHSQGQQVVGWYHSHPTFAPTPSRRDLETQSAFTDHFWPFVGAIISPFGHSSASASELCFWMMDGNIPRQLNVHHGDIQGILDEELLRNLFHRVRFHPDRTALHESYFQQSTYLEKMLSSLRHHVTSAGATAQVADKIIFQVRTIFDDS